MTIYCPTLATSFCEVIPFDREVHQWYPGISRRSAHVPTTSTDGNRRRRMGLWPQAVGKDIFYFVIYDISAPLRAVNSPLSKFNHAIEDDPNDPSTGAWTLSLYRFKLLVRGSPPGGSPSECRVPIVIQRPIHRRERFWHRALLFLITDGWRWRLLTRVAGRCFNSMGHMAEHTC